MKTKIAILTLALTLHAPAQQPPSGNAPIRQQIEWQQREIQRIRDEQQRARLNADRAAAREAASGSMESPRVTVPSTPETRASVARMIAEIQHNPRLSPASKARLINQLLDSLE